MNSCHDAAYLTLLEERQVSRVWLDPPVAPEETPSEIAQLALLLAPILGGRVAAHALATSLMSTFRSISGIFGARPGRLAAVPGMTEGALQAIAAAHALACSAAKETISPRELIACVEQFERYARLKMRGRAVEAVFGLFLDRKDGLIEEVRLGEGTVDHSPLYPREVVRHALLLDASAVILVSNHPSGDPTPSDRDVTMTREVAESLATINVALHDHLIVGANVIRSVFRLRK